MKNYLKKILEPVKKIPGMSKILIGPRPGTNLETFSVNFLGGW